MKKMSNLKASDQNSNEFNDDDLNQCKRTDGKFIVFVIVLFISIGLTGTGIAQNQPPQDARKVSITLSVQDAEVVLEALGNLPYKTSAPIIQSIIGQAQAQLAPPPAPVDTPAVKKETPKAKKK